MGYQKSLKNEMEIYGDDLNMVTQNVSENSDEPSGTHFFRQPNMLI